MDRISFGIKHLLGRVRREVFPPGGTGMAAFAAVPVFAIKNPFVKQILHGCLPVTGMEGTVTMDLRGIYAGAGKEL